MKIIAAEPIGISPSYAEKLKHDFEVQGHEFVFYPDRNETPQILIERLHEADIAILSNIPLKENVLSKCKNLKLIAVAFTGLDHIDLEYCRQNNIEIRNAAGYATIAVSELAIALMFDVYRKITFLDGQVRQLGTRNIFLGRQLFGKKVGIIGTGNIGTYTALMLQKIGCDVVAWNRSEKKEIIQAQIPYLCLEEILQTADIISLHLPLNQETFQILSEKKLSLLKSEAILINTARGNLVDNHALANMLQEGKLAGAGIDVFETEPPLPSNHPLLKAPNCVLCPHIGYATHEAFDKRINIVFEIIQKWIKTHEK